MDLPPIKKGENVKVFALKNRAAILQANRRLQGDAVFYDEVVESYGQ